MLKSWQRISAIIIKELLQLSRDKMTFGMVVMIPFVQLILFGYAINTNVKNIPVGVLDQSQTSISRILQSTISATNVVNFTHQYHSLSTAQTAIDSNEVRAVLIIPHDVNQRLFRHPSVGFGVPPSTKQDNNRPIAQWLVDGSDTMIAASIKSLRNMPLVELLDKPANRNTATFEVTLLYNPEQKKCRQYCAWLSSRHTDDDHDNVHVCCHRSRARAQ
jgi:ABC-2 type transport system permease protein